MCPHMPANRGQRLVHSVILSIMVLACLILVTELIYTPVALIAFSTAASLSDSPFTAICL